MSRALALLWAFLAVVELQSVQQLPDAELQGERASEIQGLQLQQQLQQRQRLDEVAERTVQQQRDGSVLDARKRRAARRQARAQEEYNEHMERKAQTARRKQQRDALGEGGLDEPSPPPPPEQIPKVSWDPNAIAPNPAEVSDGELPDQDQVASEPDQPDARSQSGPAPPRNPEIEAQVASQVTDPDSDQVPQPDPHSAYAWAQAGTVENTGGRNQVQQYPNPTTNFVRKFFIRDGKQMESVVEPRDERESPPDPVNLEKYMNASVLAHTGGQLAPEDSVPPSSEEIIDPNLPRGTSTMTTSTVTAREQPIVRDDTEDAQMAPAVSASLPEPAPPSVPAAEMKAITEEADEYFKVSTLGMDTQPASVHPKELTKYKEGQQKAIAAAGVERRNMIDERKSKYLFKVTTEARTLRERETKKEILLNNQKRSAAAAQAEVRLTSDERAGKKVKYAEMQENTAKERVSKPSAADQEKADDLEKKADLKNREELEKEEELNVKAAHDVERKRLVEVDKERQEKGKLANEKNEKGTQLGDILAKDAYMASLRSKNKQTSTNLRDIATSLEMKVQHGIGIIDR